MSFWPKLWGVSFFSLLFVCQSELTEFSAELSESGAEPRDFSLPKALLKQYSAWFLRKKTRQQLAEHYSTTARGCWCSVHKKHHDMASCELVALALDTMPTKLLCIHHLSQNYYITAPSFWTINLRNVEITSQKLSWNYFKAPCFLQGIGMISVP